MNTAPDFLYLPKNSMARILRIFFYLALSSVFVSCENSGTVGSTEITRWQYGKNGAVSLTYDDGISTQFSEALPIMQRLQLPATFFIITGPIAGSQYPEKFVGRPIREIVEETAVVPTKDGNFFERASASRYVKRKGSLAAYDQSANLYESGKKEAAYGIMDELYRKVRLGILPAGSDTSMEAANEKGLTWNSIKRYAAEGYEFASHSVSHARLAVTDTANMRYELEKSKEDIRENLGEEHTFSAEIPFGIEDPRVMENALPFYPALRNRMTDSFLREINRGDTALPGVPDKEYVQWQRGPLSHTSPAQMQSWIDTVSAHNNIWLVLVFHGIDNVGWEPLPHELLDTYFQYIKNKEDKLWIAPFKDVVKYMRERMSAKLGYTTEAGQINIHLNHDLDKHLYHLDLTLKTYVPDNWNEVTIIQDGREREARADRDRNGHFIIYQASPVGGVIALRQKRA